VVKALRYKPEGRGFDSRLCYWNFSVTLSFRSRYGPAFVGEKNFNIIKMHGTTIKKAR
jgi:hypothetical protein